jgi:MinD-like ATPase involved in chromosome partitioning or flagellar assembly/tetratricopeptide (TPR) repeat protein
MQTTTFFSYKGGTGRSLAVANAASYLSQLGFKVAVLDLDLEAPGLNYKFSRAEDGSPIQVNLGIVDYLHRIVVAKAKPDSIKNYTTEVNLLGQDFPHISLIPAGKVPSLEYWRKLSQLDWHELFYSADALGVEIFLDLKLRIEKEIAPDFLLIDSRTGITEMGGIATTILPDAVICILLNNRENMEGARAVLRSLQRPTGDNTKEIKVIVALSRLPVLKDKEPEVNILNKIKAFLMEGAQDLQDTLFTDQIFVLHSEPALQMRESLRVASGVSLDESVLLGDYLRLFAQFIPTGTIESRLDRLITMAKDKIWDDADAATKQMEEIAQTYITPQSLMELLRFYVLRTISGSKVLRTAQKYWEITGDAHAPILHVVVKSNFEMQPRWKTREWDSDIRFIEEVWQSSKDLDLGLGNALAETCYDKSNYDAALRIYRQLLDLNVDVSLDPFKYIPGRYISLLRMYKMVGEVRLTIERFKNIMQGNFLFAHQWATFALETNDEAYISELTQDESLFSLFSHDPELANILAKRVGKDNFAIDHLEPLMKELSPSAIDELGNVLKESGSESVFNDAFNSILSESQRQDVIQYRQRAIRRRTR